MSLSLFIVASLVLCAVATPNYKMMFESFKKEYKRKYETASEEQTHFKIFISNMKKADQQNIKNPLAHFGVNMFSDLSESDFKSHHNADAQIKSTYATKPSEDPIRYSEKSIKGASGKSIDWRTKGAVTPVKNQGQCGSCWAFGSIAGIEGQNFLAGFPLTSLSEQELTSCDTDSFGCGGGWPYWVFDWLLDDRHGNVVTEAAYPYTSGNGNSGTCVSDLNSLPVGATIQGYRNITHNEDDMAAFVYTSGPLTIGVDATSWQSYTSGIMTNCTSDSVDHIVAIVGFDDSHNPPYWIIKNSWAANWGEKGYIRIEKGTDQCLVSSNPTTSIVKKKHGNNVFEQKTCSDDKCQNCQVDTLPLGQCIPESNSSFSAQCISNAILLQQYTSTDCTGASITAAEPIDQCLIIFGQGANQFISNSCPSITPSNKVTQEYCTDSQCSQNCEAFTFATDVCIPLSSGASDYITCNSTTVTVTNYPSSAACSGSSSAAVMDSGKCYEGTNGYFKNMCGTL